MQERSLTNSLVIQANMIVEFAYNLVDQGELFELLYLIHGLFN
jgi:hypothetical protein